jgi:ATP-dependent Clp protease protease subunit
LVLEQTEHGEMPMDVYQKLANDRILFITDHINDMIATDIIATLMLKDFEDPDAKITLFINSDGGDIRNALMIFDVMQMVSAPIETVCIGSAMGEACILLAGGHQGMRFATQNSIISVSQITHNWHTNTNLTDAKNIMEQSQLDNDRLLDILSATTGKSLTRLKKDFDREVFFNAKQALKYGLIDKVVVPAK